MRRFTETIKQQEEGTRLLAAARSLHRKASKSENMPEMLALTLQALDKDLEAFSLICEATRLQKQTIEELRDRWERESKNFRAKAL